VPVESLPPLDVLLLPPQAAMRTAIDASVNNDATVAFHVLPNVTLSPQSVRTGFCFMRIPRAITAASGHRGLPHPRIVVNQMRVA